MLRRNRDINIFSMSALDLFASALGAFVILTLILLPYYLKTDRSLLAELKQTKKALQQCQAEREALVARLEETRAKQLQAEQGLEQCQEKLAKTFLLIVIQWETKKHDVDLHVIDPTGKEFYWQAKTISNRPGELSADTTHGPGVEIWEVSPAPPGRYQVYYKFYRKNGNSGSVQVQGGVYFRDDHRQLRDITLNREGEKPLVATIDVNDNGDVSIH